jgi:hypothetical protein
LLFLVPIQHLDFVGYCFIPLKYFPIQIFKLFLVQLTGQYGTKMGHLTPDLGAKARIRDHGNEERILVLETVRDV